MRAPEDFEGVTLRQYAVIEPVSGLAADVPLGLQGPAFLFKENPDIVERIMALREKHGIVIEDDKLTEKKPVEKSPDDTVRKGTHKTVKPRSSTKPQGRRTKPGEKKMDTSLTVAERAAYMEWKMWEFKGTPGVFPAQLRRYWLGEGLSRWATKPTPYRSLRRALRSEGVPGRMIDGLAARLYHWHFGRWPGKRGGGKKSYDDMLVLQHKFAIHELETK
ncbi:hypothetical protein PBI_GRAY_28 [Gordonia phage Gray]|nr:hypothetical protein PBI_GRAY_28 [Gordonia phage Gray]